MSAQLISSLKTMIDFVGKHLIMILVLVQSELSLWFRVNWLSDLFHREWQVLLHHDDVHRNNRHLGELLDLHLFYLQKNLFRSFNCRGGKSPMQWNWSFYWFQLKITFINNSLSHYEKCFSVNDLQRHSCERFLEMKISFLVFENWSLVRLGSQGVRFYED